MAYADRLARLLPPALLLAVAAAFLLPTEAAYALVFYIVVLPCLVAAVMTRPRPRDVATWLAVALILWSGLTLLWGVDDTHRAPRFALSAAATLTFMLAAAMCARDAAWRWRLGTVLLVLGGLSAAACVKRHAAAARMGGHAASGARGQRAGDGDADRVASRHRR